MERDQLRQTNARQVVGLAAVALLSSTLTALGVVFALRKRRKAALDRAAITRAENAPIQPAINTEAPSGVPDHFTENLLVPGHTYSGIQIEEQDDRLGRSPEGV